ncbi:hypothetical protein BGX23_003023 [Mortierella sp. AD031]|nr:hypothetical protein BGX23_003023 [Mortierella sp. AD031]
MPSSSTQQQKSWPLEQGQQQHYHLQQQQQQLQLQQEQQRQQEHVQFQLEQQRQLAQQQQQQVQFLERKFSKRTRLETEEDMSVDTSAGGQFFMGFDSHSPQSATWPGDASSDGAAGYHHAQFVPMGVRSGHPDAKRRKGDWSGEGSSMGGAAADGIDSPMEIA